MTTAIVPAQATCHYCGAPFWHRLAQARYCSMDCVRAARKLREAERAQPAASEDEPDDDADDAEEASQRDPSTVPPRVESYDLSCLSCGWTVEVRWDAARARLEMVASRFRCGRCRGAILIAPADYGAISSPPTTTPVRSLHKTRAWRLAYSEYGALPLRALDPHKTAAG